MPNPLALIVDDEPDIRELLEITLQRMSIDTLSAGDVAQSMRLLSEHQFALCLVDLRLPDGDGIEIVRHMGQHHPDTPVAMITAHGNMDSAIEALKAGAFDFVSKPVELAVLRQLVETALRLNQSVGGESDGVAMGAGQLLGESTAMQDIRRMIGKLSRSQAPVFVTGESGTGKELASRLIHQQSPRSQGPFVAVNCGAIPAELMESELFGHVKGSFSGAVRDKPGLFQSAQGGTLFLDEVADLPLHMQVKLLRVIQEKRLRPIGAIEEVTIDVRLISASHRNMPEMVANGEFRQDLFYRLHVIELNMPPLRERRQDIPLMVNFLLRRIAQQNHVELPQLMPDAQLALSQYGYPGNVRELENILERACALCEQSQIEAQDLGLDLGLTSELTDELTSGLNPEPQRLVTELQGDLESHLSEVERQLIEQALMTTHWNRTAAAKQLGLSLRSLRYRMEKLGLETNEN